jgi:sugar-phosphatase
MIEAIIYDMDGVILDSEPFWQEAEIKVFATVGLNMTTQMCMETTGTAVDEMIALRFRQFSLKGKTQEEVMHEIVDGVERSILERGEMLPGVGDSIGFFQQKNLPLALASSSPVQLIDASLKKFGLEHTFRIVHSAEHEDFGKPHPAVFLSTARLLRVEPMHCLVIEDSVNGLIAAKAAIMKTIAVPAAEQFDDPRFSIADLKLHTLAELREEKWGRLAGDR